MASNTNEYLLEEQLVLPQNISNECNTNKFMIKESIKDSPFGYIYIGSEFNQNKDIILKFISKNGYLMAREIMQLMTTWDEDKAKNMGMKSIIKSLAGNDKPNKNTFIDILEVQWNNEAKNCFMVMGKKLNNLIDLVGKVSKYDGWKGFYYFGLKTLAYLHRQGVIVNNLKTTSFWYAPSGDKGSYENEYDKIFIADYEFWCRFEVENKTYTVDPQILELSKQRLRNRPLSLTYCSLGRQKGEPGCAKSDYESLFYIYLELINGKLPWSTFPNNEVLVRNGKTAMRTPSYREFGNLDTRLYDILYMIDRMSPHKVPNISKLYNKFVGIVKTASIQGKPQNDDENSYFMCKVNALKASKFTKEEPLLIDYYGKQNEILNKKPKCLILEEKISRLKNPYEHEVINDPIEEKLKILNIKRINDPKNVCKSPEKPKMRIDVSTTAYNTVKTKTIK
uniref:Protein kinase domain-containing protein n=1 Tax=Strongyloides venezuelensis TaxID=75913 RepID=A0A0K0EU42_STRVS